MNTTQAQQKALDDALVASVNRLEFGKCNMRLKTDIKPKEATFQVVLDALALTLFYRAFLITFCPKIPGQVFEDLPPKHDILSFSKDLGHTGDITYLTDVNVDCLHQPWRVFATVINKCLSGKETRMDKIRAPISRRNKIFWHTARDDTMFTSMRCISRHEDTQAPKLKYIRKKADSDTSPKKKPIQGAKGTRLKSKAKVAKPDKKKQPAKKTKAKGLAVLSEKALDDALVAPVDHLEFGKCNMRLKTDIKPKEATFQVVLYAFAFTPFYQAFLITTEVPAIYMQEFWAIISVHKHEDTQVYEKAPKPKYIRKKADLDTSPKKKTIQATKGTRLKSKDKVDKSNKKKQPAKMTKAKGLNVLSEVALTEAEQMKLATKRSKNQFHSSHASGSGDGVDTQSKVPDEQQQKAFSQDDEDAEVESDKNDDSEETELDNDGDDLTHPNLSTYKAEDQEEEEEEADEEEEEEEKADDEDEEDDDDDELYRDVNINLERNDAEMTDAQVNQDTKDTHVTLTNVAPVVQQQSSSVSSDFPDTCIDSILYQDTQLDTLINVPISVAAETPSSVTTIPQPLIPNIQPLQQTPTSTTTNPTMTLPEIPNFASLFQFDQRVSALESKMSEFRQTSQFAKVVSLILGIVDTYLASKMKEAVDVAVQLQTHKLREEAQAENQEFLNQIDSTMKGIIKEQVQAQVSKIMPKIVKYVTESLEAEVSDTQNNLYNALVESYNIDKDIITSYGDVVTLKRGRDDQDKDEDPSAGSNRGSKRRRSGKEVESSKEPKDKESKSTSSSKSASKSQPQSSGNYAHAEEHDQKTADLEGQPHQEFDTGNEDVSPVREALNEDVWHRNPSRPLTLDREWHKTKTVDNRPPQPWVTQMAQAAGTQSSFNEFLATPIDFSAFIMHWLKIDNLTQKVLIGPTYDLIKGTCKSVVELEYHLEEVFKATNDRLNWHNPEGNPYPHDLNKPLPLILNEHGRQVIPLDHFINNNLKYLKGGSSSQKYTTSITKTKAADYGQVTSLKIMKWFGYSHLEEIIVQRQDDQLYKFREGDFKRLCRQDIKDMLLLLVQDKLTNLNLEERYALNVALRMFTKRIFIQERVEDLQLGVESYQKKINLKKPDTYRLDLRRMTPYTAYPDIQGIIYVDEMNKNRLMRTDELHKFSDGTLNHVRTTLNDIDRGIEMDYLPKRK
ncbi:hypothetical protein Tco_0293929 [Tanacetum coccineum]